MSKPILRALPELISENVITSETAEKIRSYYDDQPGKAGNRLFIVFGILGALLVGMGIVLILAHNWDQLGKPARLVIGLTPMVIGQGLCCYLLLKRSGNAAWSEGASVFLFLAVAVSIAVVSQVYNLEGSLGSFLLIWMWLVLPIAYVMRSSVSALLFIAGITWYACEAGYFTYRPHTDGVPMYWLLLALTLPFYYFHFLARGIRNNFFHLHTWAYVISLTVCLGVLTDQTGELIFIAYLCLFSAFVSMSHFSAFETLRTLASPFLVVGSLGVISLLLSASFDFYWEEVSSLDWSEIYRVSEFPTLIVLLLLASILLYRAFVLKGYQNLNSKASAYLFFSLLVLVGAFSPVSAQLLTNLLILVFSIHTIYAGANRDHLGILNYGLCILTALVLCRFFDTDLSFVIRGLLFIGVGVGFFLTNYYAIRKRKDRMNT